MKMDEEPESDDKYTPDWAHRANHIPHRPDWIDAIPHELWELGEVFFPIPKGRKGWNWPHHIKRYEPDDEILNAYLEAGSGYGIACAGDLIVIDVDEKEYIEFFTDKLPETIWQITGSREGYHLFYFCEDQDSRIILRVPYPEDHLLAEGHYHDMTSPLYRHFGEVKADEHGYVVGPGSKHPSGNIYGPLQGEQIERISQEELKEKLKQFINNEAPKKRRDRDEIELDNNKKSKYNFFALDADDVVPWLEPEKRTSHPGHGSRSGINFMKNEDRETFVCWRHQFGGSDGCVLTALQLLAQIETGRECDEIKRNWPYYDEEKDEWEGNIEMYWYAWKQAVKRGLVSYRNLPYRVIKSFAVKHNWIMQSDEVSGKMYWDAINTIKIMMEEPHLPNKKND